MYVNMRICEYVPWWSIKRDCGAPERYDSTDYEDFDPTALRRPRGPYRSGDSLI